MRIILPGIYTGARGRSVSITSVDFEAEMAQYKYHLPEWVNETPWNCNFSLVFQYIERERWRLVEPFGVYEGRYA